jgi:hypothetical protein
VLVLHQGRVREHLVHGDALLVGVAVDLIAGHLLKKKEKNILRICKTFSYQTNINKMVKQQLTQKYLKS